MDQEQQSEKITMYAPLEPCRHHVSSKLVHAAFGDHKESIVSKKITILLKICGVILLAYLYLTYALPKIPITTDTERLSSYIFPMFFAGYTIYQFIHLFYQVDLFEQGLVYHALFTHREFAYDYLYDIKMRYDEQFHLDERRHGILWFIFAKRFYRYYTITFSSGKGLILRPRVFAHLDEKITDLQRNLIEMKVEGES